MDKFEAAIKQGVADGTAAGVSVIAIDDKGNTIYSSSFGPNGPTPDSQPVNSSTVMWMASMTKLLTAVSVLQCVERGQLTLDDPVGADLLPEYNGEGGVVITGFEEGEVEGKGKPILEKVRAPTLRELLTHTSGSCYSPFHPLLTRYWSETLSRSIPDIVNSTIAHSYQLPLVFPPGTSWMYGSGVDWAGKVVERAQSKSTPDKPQPRLGEYMKTHIFDVLGMTSTTFRPTISPEIMQRMGSTSLRDANTGKFKKDDSGMFPVVDPGDDYGGNGIYSCADDYIKVLKSLLSNDSKLLSPKWRDELLRPCLTAEPKGAMNAMLSGPFGPFLAPGLPLPGSEEGNKAGANGEGIVFDYSLSGAVVVNDGGVKGLCSSNTNYWSGYPCSQWFIDREKGTAGVFATYVFPAGDMGMAGLYRGWREGVWGLVK